MNVEDDQLRTVARDFEIRGGEEGVIHRAHIDVPGVRAIRVGAGHRGDRGIAAFEIGIDHPNLEKPFVGIHGDASTGSGSIVVGGEVYQGLPKSIVAIILVRSGDEPTLRIHKQDSGGDAHVGVRLGIRFHDV